jgi:uncharacterized repeat protein (TIGR01451 family)/LPXTG-motif cell wall-anchored protein
MMNKIIAAIRRAPKRVASLAIVATAVVVPAALFAWGPDRPTFTVEQPAPYVAFNSITNNQQKGDERNFVQIKEGGASNATYGEEVTLQPGKEYEVFVFYHNNAASSLNDAAHNYKGVAKDAFMRVQMPASVKASEKARITAFVGASNATPAQVWDEAYGNASGDYALRYVPDSATIFNNGAINGTKLPDNLYTTGTPLGYNALDGTLPGCNEFAGYVTFRFRVDQPNFEIEKNVSKAGAATYAKEITALPGEEVEYKIKYKNTGTTQQNDVVIKDILPKGISYVAGSTYVSNSSTNNQWAPITNNAIVTGGINIGSYAPGGAAYIKFKAKVTDNASLEKCGINSLINTATAETNDGSKSDTATVVVSKTCDETQNECKPGIPVGDDRCTPCEVPGKEDLPKNSPDCVTPPVELPHTGAGDSIAALVGAGSLIAAAGYYIASRRVVTE